jgi:hypothetical protein
MHLARRRAAQIIAELFAARCCLVLHPSKTLVSPMMTTNISFGPLQENR